MNDIIDKINKIKTIDGKIKYYIKESEQKIDIFFKIFDLIESHNHYKIYSHISNSKIIIEYLIKYFQNNPLEIFRYNLLLDYCVKSITTKIKFNDKDYEQITNHLNKNIILFIIGLPEALRKNECIINEIIKIEHIPTWINYIKENKGKYRLLPKNLKENVDITKAAIINSTSINHSSLPSSIKKNREIIIIIISIYYEEIYKSQDNSYAYLKDYINDKYILIECIKNNINIIPDLDEKLLDDDNFCKEIIDILLSKSDILILEKLILKKFTLYYLLSYDLKIFLMKSLIKENYNIFPIIFNFYKQVISYKTINLDASSISENIKYYLSSIKILDNINEYKLFIFFVEFINIDYKIIKYYDLIPNLYKSEILEIYRLIILNNPILLLKINKNNLQNFYFYKNFSVNPSTFKSLQKMHKKVENTIQINEQIIIKYKELKKRNKSIHFWSVNKEYLKNIYNLQMKEWNKEFELIKIKDYPNFTKENILQKKITIKHIKDNEFEIHEIYDNDLLVQKTVNYHYKSFIMITNNLIFLNNINNNLVYYMHRKYLYNIYTNRNKVNKLPEILTLPEECIKHISSFLWGKVNDSDFPFIQE